MASRRKSTTPCMIRPDDLVTADDPEEMDSCVDGPEENGSSHVSSSDDRTEGRKSSVNSVQEATELEKPEVKSRPQRKLQGGYECKYCPFSTQNLNEFKDHVDSNHPNVILNPLYLCAVCNFNTKKFDSLTEHNEKCHPGESNFKFKRIKLNSQTILEQTIEGSNCAVIYDTTSPQSGEDFTAFPLSKSSTVKVDCEKTPDQIRELTTSYAQCQFPDDEEVYRLIETTGLSWGEIKKWFSDQRHGNHKAVQQIKTDLSLKDSQPHKPVATHFPLLERVKGKSSEQMKKLEESFQRTSFPTQAEIEQLVADTRLSKNEIDCWFTERRALRDNLEQALLNSMGSKRPEHHLQRGTLNGVHEQDSRVRDSPLPILTSSACPEAIDGKSLCLLKDVFAQTQWPSPEEYNQLEIQTGLARTEIVRWFKDNRSALKNGTLDWMEQFQSLSNKRPNGQNNSSFSEQAQSVLQRHFHETRVQKGEGFEKLAEQSKLTNQDIVEWFTSKLGHNMPEISKSKDQHGQASVDGKRWVSLAADIDGKDYDAQKVARDLSAEHRVTG
ncbi:hypothetical protein cypCar_00025547 [Cyprinus carpio]|nr:hypothetical protein cypCar_00025547 [Cyprinus carpio]